MGKASVERTSHPDAPTIANAPNQFHRHGERKFMTDL
jgi:hypothetical protein